MKAIRPWPGAVSFVLLGLPAPSAGQDVPSLERGRAFRQDHFDRVHYRFEKQPLP